MFYKALQVSWSKGGAVSIVEVVVAIAVKGTAETLRVGVVHAGRPDCQAHPPVAHVGPDKGPGREDQLGDQAVGNKSNKTSPDRSGAA